MLYETPGGVAFSALQETVQALQPMHLRMSITIAQCRFSVRFFNARWSSSFIRMMLFSMVGAAML
jgi:hypothetical protein